MPILSLASQGGVLASQEAGRYRRSSRRPPSPMRLGAASETRRSQEPEFFDQQAMNEAQYTGPGELAPIILDVGGGNGNPGQIGGGLANAPRIGDPMDLMPGQQPTAQPGGLRGLFKPGFLADNSSALISAGMGIMSGGLGSGQGFAGWMQGAGQDKERRRLAAAKEAVGRIPNLPPEWRSIIEASDDPAGIAAKYMMEMASRQGGNPTDDMREYEYAKANGYTGTFMDFMTDTRRASASNVTVDQRGEDAFSKQSGELQAKRFDEIVQQGAAASRTISDIATLRDIGSRITTGKTAEIAAALGPWADVVGIDIDGLDDMQAFQAITARIAPTLRVPGSGATSDFEMQMFLRSLPGLGKTPEGNAIIQDTLEAIAEHQQAAAAIAAQALTGQISREEAEVLLQQLPDPMTGWRQSRGMTEGQGTLWVAPNGATVERIE